MSRDGWTKGFTILGHRFELRYYGFLFMLPHRWTLTRWHLWADFGPVVLLIRRRSPEVGE
jgi:hypothetical protein